MPGTIQDVIDKLGEITEAAEEMQTVASRQADKENQVKLLTSRLDEERVSVKSLGEDSKDASRRVKELHSQLGELLS